MIKNKINNLLIAALFFVLININYASGDDYLAYAEKMPAVIGGIQELYKNVEYPAQAKNAGTQGKVYCLIFVDEKGDVIEVKKIKGIGDGCDEAAIEALQKVKFNPGMHKGNKVKVKLAMAIEFKLS